MSIVMINDLTMGLFVLIVFVAFVLCLGLALWGSFHDKGD